MRPLAVLAVLLALGLAACGGDDDGASPSSTDSPSLTATPWITASSAPSPSPSQDAGLEQLAYIAPDGGLWLVNSDGTGQHKVADGCDGRLYWAPTGDLIACSYFSIVVFDTSGAEMWRVDDEAGMFGPPNWSPDGRRLAYVTRDYSLHVADVYSGPDDVIEPNALPLAWLGANRLLVGLDLEVGDAFRTYKAHVLDLSTGRREPLPYYDAGAGAGKRLWLAPDQRVAVVAESGHGTTPVGIYDFASGEERPVSGLLIGGVSEGIPDAFIKFSRDSETVYAAYGSRPTTIYRVDVNGAGAIKLSTVTGGAQLAFSGDGLVAWLAGGGIPGTLIISDLEHGTQVETGQGYGDMAWRPRP